MLDQYILSQMKQNQDKAQKVNDKLIALRNEEENCNKMIESLMEKEDVGIEVFSPRSADDTTKIKVGKLKQQIEEIRLQEEKLQDELEKIGREAQRYQEMLLELQENEKQEDREENDIENEKNNVDEDKENLKKILNRVDKCLNLLNTNRSQCKNELINLKYYLKALISSKSNTP